MCIKCPFRLFGCLQHIAIEAKHQVLFGHWCVTNWSFINIFWRLMNHWIDLLLSWFLMFLARYLYRRTNVLVCYQFIAFDALTKNAQSLCLFWYRRNILILWWILNDIFSFFHCWLWSEIIRKPSLQLVYYGQSLARAIYVLVRICFLKLVLGKIKTTIFLFKFRLLQLCKWQFLLCFIIAHAKKLGG